MSHKKQKPKKNRGFPGGCSLPADMAREVLGYAARYHKGTCTLCEDHRGLHPELAERTKIHREKCGYLEGRFVCTAFSGWKNGTAHSLDQFRSNPLALRSLVVNPSIDARN